MLLGVASKLVVRGLDAEHCIATWDRLLIQIWRGDTTPEAVEGMCEAARILIASSKAPVCSLSMIEPTSPPPPDLARKALAKFSRDFVPKMGLAVIAAEGGGFRPTIVRAVGITLTALMPHRVPFKFVQTVEEGARLVEPYMSASAGGAAGIERTVEELRARIPRKDVGQSASAGR